MDRGRQPGPECGIDYLKMQSRRAGCIVQCISDIDYWQHFVRVFIRTAFAGVTKLGIRFLLVVLPSYDGIFRSFRWLSFKSAKS